MIIPTVRVHHPLDHDVCMIVNADQVTDIHQLWTDSVSVQGNGLSVSKGPRGLWFVKRDGETISGGFKTEAEAEAAMTEAGKA